VETSGCEGRLRRRPLHAGVDGRAGASGSTEERRAPPASDLAASGAGCLPLDATFQYGRALNERGAEKPAATRTINT